MKPVAVGYCAVDGGSSCVVVTGVAAAPTGSLSARTTMSYSRDPLHPAPYPALVCVRDREEKTGKVQPFIHTYG